MGGFEVRGGEGLVIAGPLISIVLDPFTVINKEGRDHQCRCQRSIDDECVNYHGCRIMDSLQHLQFQTPVLDVPLSKTPT